MQHLQSSVPWKEMLILKILIELLLIKIELKISLREEVKAKWNTKTEDQRMRIWRSNGD